MGAWGVGPFDSDEGLDIRERWENWLNGYDAIGYEQAIKLFFDHWGDAIAYGDSITNNEVIALAALHHENNKEIPSKLASAVEDAINRELEPSEIDKWKDSEKQARREFLRDLLEKVGGSRRKPKNPNLILDPALHFRSLGKAKASLLKSFQKIKGSKVRISLSKAGFPSFILTLDRFMNHRVWEKDSKIYLQARNERLLMIAAYLALRCNYSEAEFKSFLDEIERRTTK